MDRHDVYLTCDCCEAKLRVIFYTTLSRAIDRLYRFAWRRGWKTYTNRHGVCPLHLNGVQ